MRDLQAEGLLVDSIPILLYNVNDFINKKSGFIMKRFDVTLDVAMLLGVR